MMMNAKRPALIPAVFAFLLCYLTVLGCGDGTISGAIPGQTVPNPTGGKGTPPPPTAPIGQPTSAQQYLYVASTAQERSLDSALTHPAR
jgi:hypothetical protein